MNVSVNISTKRLFFWLAVALLFFWFIYAIKAVLLPFVVGMLVAYFLDPAADKLEKWGLSRLLSTLIITLGFFSLVGLALSLLLPLIYHQLAGLIESLPDYIRQVKALVEPKLGVLLGSLSDAQMGSAEDAASGVSAKILASLGDVSANLLYSGVALLNLISLVVITPVVSFYLLKDWDVLVAHVDRLLPRDYAPVIREQLTIIDHTISGFVRGTLNVIIVLALYYVLALSLVGLKFSVLIGLMAGFMILIPYLGTVISGLTSVGMAYLQFDSLEPVAAVLVIFVVAQMVEGYFLTPKLVGKKVGLHPVWLIFGMLAGATLFGFVGVFIAVPVTAVIGVLVRFAIQRYEASDYYQSQTGKQ